MFDFSSGEIWEGKLQHCSNLIHWMPFDLLNENEITNIYARDNYDTYLLACKRGQHCLVRSPIFSQLGKNLFIKNDLF